jgi:hypothetical protein
VISDCACKNAKSAGQLFLTIDTIAYLFPIHKVFTVKNRNTREISKGACNQVIVIANPANAGIGMKTRYYRVAISNRFIRIWLCGKGLSHAEHLFFAI